MVRGATILGPGSNAASSSFADAGAAARGTPRPAAAGGASSNGGGGWTVVSDDESGDCLLGEVNVDDCDSTLSGSGMHRSQRPQRRRGRPVRGGELSIPESLPSEMGSITIEEIDDEGSDGSVRGAFKSMSRRRKMLVIGAAVLGLLMSSLLAYNGYRWRREAARLEEELRRVTEERALSLQQAAVEEEEQENSEDSPNIFSSHHGRTDDDPPTFLVDNCWLRAEATVSLGQCTADARDNIASSLFKASKTAEDGFQNFFGAVKDAAQGSWEAARDSPWTPNAAATAAAKAAYTSAQDKTRAASEAARERARDTVKRAERSTREAARRADQAAREAAKMAEQAAKDAARKAEHAAKSTAKAATKTARVAEELSKRALHTVKIASQNLMDELSEATAGMSNMRSAEVLGVEAAVAIEDALGDLWEGMRGGIEEHTTFFTRHVGGAEGETKPEQGKDSDEDRKGSKGAAASAAEMLQRAVYL